MEDYSYNNINHSIGFAGTTVFALTYYYAGLKPAIVVTLGHAIAHYLTLKPEPQTTIGPY